jgi:hypothetical protein
MWSEEEQRSQDGREREKFAKSFLLPSDDSEENPENSLILLCFSRNKNKLPFCHFSFSISFITLDALSSQRERESFQ